MEAMASVPCAPKQTAAVRNPGTRFTVEELKELARLLDQARHVLHVNDRMSDLFAKPLWIEIANKMHAMGWPQRSWVRLRDRGEKMLSKTVLAIGASQSNNGTTTESPKRALPRQSVSVTPPAFRPIPAPVTGSTYNILHKALSLNQIRNSGPPPLVPSTGVSPTHTGPQIVNVMSWASQSNRQRTEHATNDTISHKGPSILCQKRQHDPNEQTVVTSSQLVPTDFNRIDLLSDSDEDEHFPTSQTLENSDQNKRPREMDSKNSSQQSDDQRNWQLTTADYAMRMRLYEKKLQILEWKKAYWVRKLQMLKQSGEPH